MRTIVSVFGLLLCAAPAFGADQLAWKIRPGIQQTVLQESRTEQTLKLGGTELPTKSTVFARAMRRHGDAQADGSVDVAETIEALQMDLSLPGGIQFTFDSGSPNAKPAIPQLQPVVDMLNLLSKAEWTTRFDACGRAIETKLKLPPETKAPDEFKGSFDEAKRLKLAKQLQAYLPEQPVSPGDTWEASVDAELGQGQNLSTRIRCKFVEVVMKESRSLHRITLEPFDVTFAMDPASASAIKVTQAELKVKSGEGEMLFDNALGELVSRTSKINVTGTLVLSVNGQPLDSAVEFTISEKTSVQP